MYKNDKENRTEQTRSLPDISGVLQIIFITESTVRNVLCVLRKHSSSGMF
jgi:hypothetical protein